MTPPTKKALRRETAGLFHQKVTQFGQRLLSAVLSDGLHRAPGHGLVAQALLFIRLRLFVDIRMTTIIVPLEIRRSRLTTEVTVDALVIDVKSAGGVQGIGVSFIGHGIK
jgi:hypothetical protein